MASSRFVSTLALSLLLSGPLSAAVDRWTPVGPDGGAVLSLAAASGVPGLVYAGTATAGVLQSRDGGASWEPARSGLPSGEPIRLLAAGGRDGRFLYAATRLALYASADGGHLWTQRALPVQIPSGLPDAGIVALAASPAASGTLFLSYSLSGSGGLLKSTNGGRTWRTLNTGVTPAFPPGFLAIAFAPSAPATIYLSADNQGEFLRSTDGGSHWTVRSGNRHFQKLAVDPRNPQTVFAALMEIVFKSTDGGATWSLLAKVEPTPQVGAVAADLAIDPASPATIHFAVNRFVSGDGTWYGGGIARYEGRIFRTTDGGASWSQRAVTDPVAALEIDARPSRVYAGVSRVGILRSTDRGTAWTKSNRGLTAASGYAVTPDPFTRDLVYLSAGSPAGFDIVETNNDPGFFRGDAGGHWTAVNRGVREPARVLVTYGIVADPLVAGTLYALTGQGLFKSVNGGGRWESLQDSLGSILEAVLALAIDPTDSRSLYAVGYKLGYPSCGGFCPLLPAYDSAKSTDGGVTWTRLVPGTLPLGFEFEAIADFAIAIDPVEPRVLYIANSHKSLIKSVDGGVSWTELTVRPAALEEKAFVSRLVIDPSSPRTLYAVAYFSAAGFRTVVKSTDGGQTWTQANQGVPRTAFVRDLTLDPSRPATLYAATSQGVFVSDDGGAHWSSLSQGLTNGDVFEVGIDPFDPATLYAATLGDGGLFVLTRTGR
jgi:photosystem II stability/assembly factor-like uncharacterized protein